MKLNAQRFIILSTVVVSLIGSLLSSARDKGPTAADRRKADYIFMEAQRQRALDETDSHFQLLQRAYSLDTTATSVGQDLGYYYLAMASDKSTMGKLGFQLMKRHFDANPSDYYSSIFYGSIVNQLRLPGESRRVWTTLDSIFPNKTDIAVKLAESYTSSADPTDWDRALTTIQRIEDANGKDGSLSAQRIRIYVLRNDTAAVVSELQSLIQYSPENIQNIVYAGDVYDALGRPDSAIVYYNRACQLDPTSGLAHYRRAFFYRENNDSINYEREILQTLMQPDLDPDVKKGFITSYVQDNLGDSTATPKINSVFSTVVSLHPRDTDLRDLYAQYLSATDQYSSAVEQLHYAIDIDPSNADRWYLLIQCLANDNNYDEAIAEGKKAVEYVPDEINIYAATAGAAMGANRYDEALDWFKKALDKCAPTDAVVRSNILTAIGDCYYQLNDRDNAFQSYRDAIDLNSTNYLAKNNYAYFLACDETDLDTAERYAFDVITAADNKSATSIDTYAWVLFKQKKYEQAKQYIDQALTLEENQQADVYDHAGDIYYWNQLIDQAVKYWQKALELDPDNANIRRKVNNKAYYK